MATLIGGNAQLTTSAAQGSVALQIAPAAGFPAQGSFTIWILDGANSEKAQASLNGSTLNISGATTADHSAGCAVCSAGSAGSLGDILARASRLLENYCRQGPDGAADRSLYALPRAENANGPGPRVAWDRDDTLVILPWRWPAQSVISVALTYSNGAVLALNPAKTTITCGGRTLETPFVAAASQPEPYISHPQEERWTGFTAAWIYTAGPCGSGGLSGVPDDIRQACLYFTADLLALRANPYGLSQNFQGASRRIFRFRGDPWITALRAQALALLEPYAQTGWDRP